MQSNARTKLKEAGATITHLGKEIQKLEESLNRSKEIASEAEASLASFGKLHNAISSHRAESVKAGRDPRRLPEDLKRQIAARKEAVDEVEQAQGTVDLLTEELDDKRARLQRLQPELAPLAAAVLAEEYADVLGGELFALEQRRWELRTVLSGFASLQHFDPQKGYVALGRSNIVAAAFSGYSPGEYPAAADVTGAMAGRWKVLLNTLVRDPDALIAELKPVTPSDYYGK